MLIYWPIRYLDRAAKQLKSKCLILATDAVDAIIRAAIELIVEEKSNADQRRVLQFKKYFKEGSLGDAATNVTAFRGVCLDNYIEDDAGNEISMQEAVRVCTGNPNAIVFPPGSTQHDIDYCLSEPTPVPVESVTLSADDLTTLGYFVRDFRAVIGSDFYSNGAGSLSSSGDGEPVIRTPGSDADIKAFATEFRRLYMTGERANFCNSVSVFVKALGGHRLGKWVDGVRIQYEADLLNNSFVPFLQSGATTFTTKDLVDVFIYTQVAHQPTGRNEHRQTEYNEYLRQLRGKRDLLTWLSLTEMWKLSHHFVNAGRVIENWLKRYCDHHEVSPAIVPLIKDVHPGLGSQEKDADRKERLFKEKSENLAADLWKKDGSPAGGPANYLTIAAEQLRNQLGGPRAGGVKKEGDS